MDDPIIEGTIEDMLSKYLHPEKIQINTDTEEAYLYKDIDGNTCEKVETDIINIKIIMKRRYINMD